VRVFNFAAGPATLPVEVLEQVRDELLDWQGSGASVMEVSHRGKAFMAVAQESEALLRELLAVPADYHVLFLQGGATGQFAAVPLNLARAESTVDYLNTGHWSQKALREAQRYTARVNVVADEAASRYTTVPAPEALRLTPDAAYLHYTPNETIGGVEFPYIPETGSVPLVADMSSTLLSRPLEVARFGLIYAGAQKNIGPAGLVVVIVRRDLVGKARAGTPAVAGLVLRWLKRQGGLAAMAAHNRAKAQLLYDTIDASGFYRNPVDVHCRSWMNVPFTLADARLDEAFLAGARAGGLVNLAGHRSVGGMRASLYNAMPFAGVEALVAFMRDFARRHG